MLKYGTFWNKLFAEAVNTEINGMQVRKSVWRKTETKKKLFAALAEYKKMFKCEYFPNQDTRIYYNGRTCSGNLNSVIYKQSVCAKFVLSNTFVYKAITPLKNSQNLTTLYGIVTRNS